MYHCLIAIEKRDKEAILSSYKRRYKKIISMDVSTSVYYMLHQPCTTISIYSMLSIFLN
jgi:hypothetical protein